MKFIDKILIILIALMIFAGIIIPFVVLFTIDFSQKSLGDIFGMVGNSSSPFISISAVLIVIYTFLYQRRNDSKIQSKELVLNLISNIKEEFREFEMNFTMKRRDSITQQLIVTEKSYKGRNALKYIVDTLNSDSQELNIMDNLPEAESMVNIYYVVNGLIDELKSNRFLTTSEKRLLLTQLHLFYSNNLYIDKTERGDEFCEFHKITHTFPKNWKALIDQIESKFDEYQNDK